MKVIYNREDGDNFISFHKLKGKVEVITEVIVRWNLNVEKRRTYFGVGFGFIEIGKEVAKYVTK